LRVIMPKGYKGNKTKFCSRCKIIKENESSRYCRKCSSEYVRAWRKRNPKNMNDLQKLKDSVRHKTNMKIKRGFLIPLPCEICSEKKVEAHHDNYDQPYCVRWLCFKCHRNHHKEVKSNETKKV
jgi:hypothetical protein